MQSKKKSISIIVSTLILGVILGGLASGIFMHHHRGRLMEMRHKSGFIREFERIVNPADEQQAAEIREILDEFHQEFRTLGDGHFEKIQALFDSLKNRLEPILTDEQRRRLDHRHKRMRFCKEKTNGKQCKPMPPHRAPIFEKFDTDSNGTITKEEFEDFHNQKQRKGKR